MHALTATHGCSAASLPSVTSPPASTPRSRRPSPRRVLHQRRPDPPGRAHGRVHHQRDRRPRPLRRPGACGTHTPGSAITDEHFGAVTGHLTAALDDMGATDADITNAAELAETIRADSVLVLPLMIPGEWMAAAACANADPDLFTGTPGMEPATTRSARGTRAKTICARCPVRVECLTYAVTAEVPLEGVWGGCGESELRIATGAWPGTG